MASLLRHLDGWRCQVFIGHFVEYVAQAIQAGAEAVIGHHGELWVFRDMCIRKHGFVRFLVLHTAIASLEIHWTHLPAPLSLVLFFTECLVFSSPSPGG